MTVNQKVSQSNSNKEFLPLSLSNRPKDRLSCLAWWQKGVIYHIYPRSFADANGDGIGDLQGIINKLPYLKYLGVSAVWLSPIYPSPMKDGGYDVSDYCNIDPQFGSLEQMDELIRKARRYGMGIIMDIVANHTSDQNQWFKDSLHRKNKKDEWYIWAKGKIPGPNSDPPNNWLSFHEGTSAWTYSPEREEWYFHKFLKEQPDLNLWNPQVQKAISDVMRFWLDRGVAGFRFDVLDHYFEDPALTDMVLNPDWKEGQFPVDRLRWKEKYLLSEVYTLARSMRELVDLYTGRQILLISENTDDLERIIKLYESGIHMPSNLRLVGSSKRIPYLKTDIDLYMAIVAGRGWPNIVLNNHDNPRREGDAKLEAVLLMTMGGTPIIYYGQEIGMLNTDIPDNRMQDEQGKRLGKKYSRDSSRTPMQWDDKPGAGFTRPDTHNFTWLPIDKSYKDINVTAQRSDSDSLLSLYRRLIRLRNAHPALTEPFYQPIQEVPDDIMAYIKEGSNGESILVALNSSDQVKVIKIHKGSVLLSTNPSRRSFFEASSLELAPKEGCIVKLT